MLLDYFRVGLVWYYMNVIAMAVIIYMILKLAIARTKRVVINQTESKSVEDKMFIRFVMFVAIFGLIYFFLREYMDQLEAFGNWIQEVIKEMKNDR